MSKYYSSEIGSITITMINVNILVGKTFKNNMHFLADQLFEQTLNFLGTLCRKNTYSVIMKFTFINIFLFMSIMFVVIRDLLIDI